MPYTTQGYMTAQDVAEVRADMDLDLCGCCEGGDFIQDPDAPDGVCDHCAHDHG